MIFEIFVGAFTLLSVVYLWYVSDYGYWRKQGVPYAEPEFPWGALKDVFLVRKTMGEVFAEIYRQFPDASACGYFGLGWPVLMLRDPELIKTVLVKDFAKFHDNGFQISMATDPMLGINPFCTNGNKWKVIRSIHTPTHTVSKLKTMMADMYQPCRNMLQYLKENGEMVEAKDMSSYYTMDVVGACGFGMTGNSFLGPEHGFRKAVAGELFSTNYRPNIASICAIFAPTVNNIFNFRVISKGVENFFVQMVKEVAQHREKTGFRRNDLIQQLLDEKCYTPLEMAGHCMTLFIDGNETASILLAFALYELASHPQIQQALRDEIFASGFVTLEDITYEKLHSLSYLDMVVNETLRLHPPIQQLSRLATEETVLNTRTGKQIKVKKGGVITIPVLGLHMDPELHHQPEHFSPERFLPEARKHMHKFAFLPFGEGPRICVGSKFALAEVKLALVAIIGEFELRLHGPKAPIVLNPLSTFVHTAKNGLRLQFVPLQKHESRTRK